MDLVEAICGTVLGEARNSRTSYGRFAVANFNRHVDTIGASLPKGRREKANQCIDR
jgi:hypothetical protein